MTWILTNSGKQFDYLDPQPDQIVITDIAIGLSREPRFSGQSTSFYSVAQHCLMASQVVCDNYQPEYALEALLHDAQEAYCKDIPSPLKRLLPDYQLIENRVESAIRAKFNLPAGKSDAVRKADMIMLVTEKRDLMPIDKSDWGIPKIIRPLARPIYPLNQPAAYSQFLRRFLELTTR